MAERAFCGLGHAAGRGPARGSMAPMRVLGGLLFVLSVAAAGYAIRGIYGSRRPRDLLFALAAPLAVLLGLLGAVLLFVPGFLD